MPEAEIYAESRKEVNIYAESILPGIRKADEIPLRDISPACGGLA